MHKCSICSKKIKKAHWRQGSEFNEEPFCDLCILNRDSQGLRL